MSWSDSVTGLPVLRDLRRTVACAAMSISAPKVFASWTRWVMVPVVVDELNLFEGS